MRNSAIIISAVLVALLVVPAWANTEYRLGPEDIITVSVIRHLEFSGEFFVPADGEVNLPGIGIVQVAGKSIRELSDYITTQLKERLKNPEVSVSLKQQRQQRIYVLGAVLTPGVYDLKPGERITESIAAAGGIIGETADCKITLMRASSAAQQTVALSDVLKANSTDNIALQPGDVVNVETVKQWPVYVMGQVKQPGLRQLREDNNGILEALALAGGPLDTAALSRVTVTHTSGKSIVVDLTPAVRDGESSEKIKLEPGDLVVVPESQDRIAVLGYVNQPGYFALKDGQKVTLSDAMGLARGLMPKKSRPESILVLRTTDGKQEKLVYNLGQFFKTGDVASNPFVKPGDVIYVPRSEAPEWDSIIRAISSTSILFNAIY